MSDESFFRQTYAAYSKMVYNLCLNYLQNAEDAEEATQDVFVKVHQQMDRFRGAASMKTWMYRITVNHCLDVIKAKKRQKRLGFSISLQGPGEADTELKVPDFDHPGVKLEDKEAVERLFALINALPDNQKT
ncbi:MAG: RNA polymerase sigma factor, partial [Bacteroidetes bacterium]